MIGKRKSYSNPTGAVKWEGIFLGDTQRYPAPKPPLLVYESFRIAINVLERL